MGGCILVWETEVNLGADMRIAAFLIAAILVAACARPLGSAKSKPIPVQVYAGETVVLDRFSIMGKDCEPRSPKIQITQEPTKGKLSRREGVIAIPEGSSSLLTTTCNRATIPAIEYVYTPNPGHTGPDNVSLAISDGQITRSVAYAVVTQ